MMETRVFDPNQAYRYYQERYDAEQRAKELEAENAELRELARGAEGGRGMKALPALQVITQAEMTNSGRYTGWLTIKDLETHEKIELQTKKKYRSRASAVEAARICEDLQPRGGPLELYAKYRALICGGQDDE